MSDMTHQCHSRHVSISATKQCNT